MYGHFQSGCGRSPRTSGILGIQTVATTTKLPGETFDKFASASQCLDEL